MRDGDLNDPRAPQPWWRPARKANGTTAPTRLRFDGGVPLGTFTGTRASQSVARQPEYLIEYLRRGTSDYSASLTGFGTHLRTSGAAELLPAARR